MNTGLTRRGLIGTMAATAALGELPAAPAFAAAQAGRGEGLAFLAIGDWGRRGEPHQRTVAAQMGRVAEEQGCAFTLALGDNFYGTGVDSVTDTHWRESFEDVYTAPALQNRWYAVLGNHDYRGNPQAQIDYSRHSRRWMMPARYYAVEGATFGAPHADFFLIDTTPLVASYRKAPTPDAKHHVHDQDPQTQYAWLDAALGRSRAGWKLVFGHHPIFSGGQHGDSEDLVRNLLPILKRHGVQAYVCGHDHDMQHIEREGIHFIATGCGSTVRPVGNVDGTRFAVACSGLSLYRVTPDALDLAFHDWAGARLYAATVTRAA
ncbi:purple acid phosphatase family protein [Novosphingobium album (ex Liu et al. 2023)]|uniref:acid phosphatase n=1 Tax=Novosphingobium album (ex Liu et al. 2023) TaxID=3031130 RepID=A0ABT5WVV9_9SPHN|nr:tartrate-resistant acid phosphatase type 5 family protein [Novosphingobium album (ex Liu et al. 2023)]MDE8654046.1 tartrate-resistant acid phosphatase type 5 family protein [Novosphingobium album (ex Liu et al. 2023)]